MIVDNKNSILPESAPLRDFCLSFISDKPISSAALHYHHCYKIAVSLDNHFSCIVDGIKYENVKGLILNQYISHSISSPDSTILFNYIEADSLYGQHLKVLLKENAWMNVESVLKPDQLDHILPDDYQAFSNHALVPYVNQFLKSIFDISGKVAEPKVDVRIQIALDYINLNIHKRLDLEEVAGKVNLSPDRMRHLFTENMSAPFSQHVIWKRIRNTIILVTIEGSTLSDACGRSGFTDSSHFSKAFKRIFGMKPSNVILDSRMLL